MKLRGNILLVLILFYQSTMAQDKVKSNELYNRAMTQFRLSHPQEAIKLLDEALSFDTLNYNAYIKRGFVKGSVGNYEGELADYNIVLNYDSTHVQAYLSRGSAYSKLKKYDLAMNDFNNGEVLRAKTISSFFFSHVSQYVKIRAPLNVYKPFDKFSCVLRKMRLSSRRALPEKTWPLSFWSLHELLKLLPAGSTMKSSR